MNYRCLGYQGNGTIPIPELPQSYLLRLEKYSDFLAIAVKHDQQSIVKKRSLSSTKNPHLELEADRCGDNQKSTFITIPPILRISANAVDTDADKNCLMSELTTQIPPIILSS
jgi:hypothetical protein